MRTITMLLFTIVLLTLTACEDKKKSENQFKKEIETNNTAIFTKKDLKKYASKKNTADINHSKYPHTFSVNSTQNKSYTFSISDKNIYSNAFKNKTIVLNISHLSSPTSIDQMESLSKTQTRHQSSILVISLVLGDTKKISTPNIFLNKHHIYHFVSFDKKNQEHSEEIYQSLLLEKKSIPLTIIYKEGAYYSHFEGAVPIEMINHDIKQTIKK